ncbi:MAG: sialate O-acetylesterase, partial [Thiothrix sp.]|nr:sialate O-acetylesterase [Thiothrix sp.]
MPVRQWIICSLLLLGTAGWTRAGFSAEYIYLLAGQSNMIGKGKVSELAPHLRRTPANVSFYYQGRQQTLARFNHFGPEVLLAHQLARALPQDHHILVKFAATGSRLIQWVPGSPLYQGLLRQLSYVQTADGKPATLAAIFWMQGESDARNLAQARAYGERLQHLIQRLRTDTGSPQAPAFIGRINPVSDAFRWRDEVRQQQQQVTQTLPMTYLVETQGLG